MVLWVPCRNVIRAVGGELKQPYGWYPGMGRQRYLHAARGEAEMALLRLEQISIAIRREWWLPHLDYHSSIISLLGIDS